MAQLDQPPIMDQPNAPGWESGHPDPHPFYREGGMGDYSGDHPINLASIAELMTQVESYMVLVGMALVTMAMLWVFYKLGTKYIRRINRI